MRRRIAAFLAAAALIPAAAWGQAAQQPAPNQVPEPRAVVPDFTTLSKTLLPGVVNVSAEVKAPRRQGPQMPPLPPPFDRFFESPEGGPHSGGGGPMRRGTAVGSGFVIDPKGIVVTNNHVIENADKITVILQDKRELPAKVLGRDERTDVAVLQIDTKETLPHVQWGDSEQAQVGEWVLAIGNPFGLGGTVTSGIISATARDIGAGPYDAFLQTDASINQGNSGGPLFNMRGQVIGINTAIFSPTGGSIGIGFAVPSSLARPIVEQLASAGVVRRGWLGVSIQPVSPQIARSLGLDQPQGALVADVLPGGPAEKAGVKAGDVIVAFNGQTIDAAHSLPRVVADTKIGSKADLTVIRQGQRQQVAATVGELPRDDKQVAERPGGSGEGQLGLALAPLGSQLRNQLGIPGDVQGVLVQGVAEGSPAAEAGLEPGMIISQVDQQPVTSPDQLRQRVGSAKTKGRDSVLMMVRTGQGSRFLAVDVSDAQVGELTPEEEEAAPGDAPPAMPFHGPGGPGQLQSQ